MIRFIAAGYFDGGMAHTVKIPCGDSAIIGT